MASQPIYDFDPLFSESETTIRDRILDPFVSDPDPERRFSVRQGSFLWDFVTTVSLEMFLLYERLNQTAAVAFLVGAYGDYLDQKGVELNQPRKGAAASYVNLTIEAAPGLVIGAGTRFTTTSVSDSEDTPVEFATTIDATVPVEGVLVVRAAATVPGTIGNVDAHTITQMVDILDGVIYVTNENPAVNGVDEESDDDYRGRLIEALQAAGGPGTVADYRVWTKEVTGVGEAIVFPHWDGGGTVKVVVIGPEVTVPSTETVRAVQDYLDPSVALLAAMDPDEAWAGAGFSTAAKHEGSTSLQITANTSTTVTARLERDEALAYITSADEFSIWIDQVSALTNLSAVTLRIEDDGGLQATLALDNTDIALGEQVYEFPLSALTVPGGFDWANIKAFEISVTATGVGACTTRFDAWRVKDINGGVGQGKAPIGAQVTVTAARMLPVDVSANVVPASGFTLPTVYPVIASRLQSYFASRRSTSGFIFLSEVANVINDTPGVLTYYDVELNGAAADLGISAQDIPVLNTLDLS